MLLSPPAVLYHNLRHQRNGGTAPAADAEDAQAADSARVEAGRRADEALGTTAALQARAEQQQDHMGRMERGRRVAAAGGGRRSACISRAPWSAAASRGAPATTVSSCPTLHPLFQLPSFPLLFPPKLTRLIPLFYLPHGIAPAAFQGAAQGEARRTHWEDGPGCQPRIQQAGSLGPGSASSLRQHRCRVPYWCKQAQVHRMTTMIPLRAINRSRS